MPDIGEDETIESADSLLRYLARCPPMRLEMPIDVFPSPSDRVGAVVGRFRLEERLGEGGMGTVWSAAHVVTGRRVALKLLRSKIRDAPGMQRRLVREAKASVAVNHPNVVTVHDIVQSEDGAIGLVMDLLEGETLRDRLKACERLDPNESARIVAEVARAVAAAHSVGVVHRDLKPDNIFLLGPKGRFEGVRVLDFGIAKLIQDGAADRGEATTETDAVIGTPAYMAPEQLFGERPLDHTADIWALGVVLYECVSGERPLAGRHLGQVVRSLTAGSILPLRARVPSLPRVILDLSDRLLDVDRRRRTRVDLQDVVETLDRFARNGWAHEPVVAGEPDAEQGRRRIRSWRGLFYSALAAVALAATPRPTELAVASSPRVERPRAPERATPTLPPAQTLVVATAARKGSHWSRMFELWRKATERKTNSRLEIEIRYGSKNLFHGGEASALSRVRTGQLDGAGLSALSLAKIHPAAMTLQVPGLVRSWQALDAARAAIRPELDAAFRREGYTIVGWAGLGRIVALGRGQPIRVPKDLRQRRVAFMEGDPLAPLLLASLSGAVPVPLGTVDVLPALRRASHGIGVSQVFAPAALALDFSWDAWVDTVIPMPSAFVVGGAIIRTASLDKVDGDCRSVLLDLARRIEPEGNALARIADEQALQRLSKRLTRVALTPAEEQRWNTLFSETAKKAGQGIVPSELLESVRAVGEAHEGR